MAQVKGSKLYNQFVAGLITEATALTYPENASYDEVNFELLRNGSRRRRRGIAKDYDVTFANAQIDEADVRDGEIVKYKWEAAAGVGSNNFYVVQVGDKLLFWDNETFLDTIDLSTHAVNAAKLPSAKCQFATGRGYLFVVNPYMEPIYVEYDTQARTFSSTEIVIQIRDTKGLDDGLDIDERPSTLSDKHLYNLLNQGWVADAVIDYYGQDPIETFYYVSANGPNTPGYNPAVYPSNADIIYLGKVTSSSNPQDLNKFTSLEIFKTHFGSTPAPKGHYILDAFNIDRQAAIDEGDIVGPLTEPTIVPEIYTARPATVAFYAGRVWYGGVANNEYTGTIFASQLLEKVEDAGKCYAINDPTSEDLSDPLATDGVRIPIQEMGENIKLISLNNALLVFASNGVWSIQGVSGAFTATDYSVRKLTNSGAISAGSIVEVENNLAYWSTSGIFLMQPDKITGYLTPQSISISTIQTLYDELPSIAKFQVSATYDNVKKRIVWYYSEEDSRTKTNGSWGTGSYRGWYDKALIFDTALQAFSVWAFSDPGEFHPIFMSGSLMSAIVGRNQVEDGVEVQTDQVQVNGDDVVIIDFDEIVADQEQLLLTIDGNARRIGWSTYSNDWDFKDFYDWSGDGAEAPAYLETGAEINQDVLRDKQVPYLGVVFQRTENSYTITDADTMGGGDFEWEGESGCMVYSKWDWFNADTGRWSTPWQAYKLEGNFNYDDTQNGTFEYEGGQTVVVTKHKLRGRGYAVQLRFEVDPGKDCHLLGWQVVGEGRTSV